MRRRLLFACAVLVLLAAALFAARPLILHHFEHGMLVIHGPGHRTPSVPYEELQIPSGDRTLRAFFVPADGPGLLIFHGNGEAISGWADALKLLHEAGIAAMVFDYSGFG